MVDVSIGIDPTMSHFVKLSPPQLNGKVCLGILF